MSKKKSKIEKIKENSEYLRGPLAEEVGNEEDHFSKDAIQVLKFHGTYQQDDRDLREGRNRHYSFMIRSRTPGGKLTPEQYLAVDEISDTYANGSIRLTTRQAFQLHGVIKGNLKQTIKEINNAFITTLGACGDIVRNVMATPAPDIDGRQAKVQEFADELSDILLPATNAYHEIWLDGEKIISGKAEVQESEPLYQHNYLPRKFKVGIALPGDNSIDVYTQDIGLVALFDDQQEIEGFNVIVGGGMGMHHRKPETFPRLGDHLGYITKEKVVEVVKGIISIQRDHGERKNRKQARMKYLIHRWGLKKFKAELTERLGYELEPYRDLPKFELDLYLGWKKQLNGKWFLGLSIENGRIIDNDELQLKTALREVVEKYHPEVRMTANHNVLLTDISEEHKQEIEDLFHRYGVLLGDEIPNAIKYSMACPALPTCGLAITESERALPDVIRGINDILEELKLENEKLSIRMTGCPNGCSRPYVADIGFVGRSLDKYSIFIGGDPSGTRLNTKYKDMVAGDELVEEVRGLLEHYKNDRAEGESFSDFWNRVGIEESNNVPA
ncbi:MAG: NADPH-dependent assimilatory sulfite reductase hemoprotein subunit [Balneolaceae bacterium]|nr:NADPH-dependent assimilatory sulfite reductase hemoprotein subunit [Balneolaceae bacterium]